MRCNRSFVCAFFLALCSAAAPGASALDLPWICDLLGTQYIDGNLPFCQINEDVDPVQTIVFSAKTDSVPAAVPLLSDTQQPATVLRNDRSERPIRAAEGRRGDPSPVLQMLRISAGR
jgi:hypothetical protein